MTYKQKRSVYVGAVSLSLIIVLLVVCRFISITFEINSVAEVFPKEKWTLSRGAGGQIVSNLIDFTRGHTTQYTIFQFERGELVSAHITNVLGDKKELFPGDTILSMRSSDIRSQIIAAKNALRVAIAEMQSLTSAVKAPLVREADNRLKYARKKSEEEKVLFDRASRLFEKGYSSQQEYDLHKWNYDLLRIDENIYAAQLENMKTGVKPEEVQLLHSQIVALQDRLNYLKERESQMHVISPIRGTIGAAFSPDTLLSITNYNNVVLHIPIKIADMHEFEEGQTVPVHFSIVDNTYNGKILSIDGVVRILNDQQVVYLSMLFENSGRRLLPGMIVQNSIRVRRISLLEYLLRTITA